MPTFAIGRLAAAVGASVAALGVHLALEERSVPHRFCTHQQAIGADFPGVCLCGGAIAHPESGLIVRDDSGALARGALAWISRPAELRVAILSDALGSVADAALLHATVKENNKNEKVIYGYLPWGDLAYQKNLPIPHLDIPIVPQEVLRWVEENGAPSPKKDGSEYINPVWNLWIKECGKMLDKIFSTNSESGK